MPRRLAYLLAAGGCLLSSWSSISYGQNAVDFERQLTGTTSHTWIFQRVVKSMGAAQGCSAGETYTFNTNHQLTVSVCTNGHMVDTKYAWSISDAGNSDVAVAITGMGTYLLLFKSPPGRGHLMRLRRNGVTQTDPVQDKEFSLDED
jgi:hypothetical protein